MSPFFSSVRPKGNLGDIQEIFSVIETRMEMGLKYIKHFLNLLLYLEVLSSCTIEASLREF